MVIGTDIRLPDGLFEHDCVRYRTCDVTSEADWQALAEATLSEHGKLDVLVNNAAILMTYTIETSSTEDYKRMMEVNSTSVFLGMKFLLDALKKSEAASIINISSHQRSRATPFHCLRCGKGGRSQSDHECRCALPNQSVPHSMQ